MTHLLSVKTFQNLIFLLFVLTLGTQVCSGQASAREKMEQLQFMVGEWVGTSTSYENDSIVKQLPAYERISYQLDQHIITIDLRSESLSLHTVIYYDEKDQTFYYQPFYKGGAAKYKAEWMEDRLVVAASLEKRFIFRLTPEGNFQEYGETFVLGQWQRYFEDVFVKMP